MIYNSPNGVYAGAYGPGNIPDFLMKYDKDRAGLLLYQESGVARLMSMIKQRFGKRDVTSFEPVWFGIGELDSVFTVLVDQSNDATEFKRIVMKNEQAVQLQMNDLLAVDGLFCADGYDGGTIGEYSRRYDTKHRMEETLMVEREPVPDSASSGNAYVYVRRGYFGSALTGRLIPEPSVSGDGLIKEGDRLLKMRNAQWTGSDAPRGKSKNVDSDNNYVQIYRYAFEAQTEYNYEQTYLREDQMDINRKLALKQMTYEMEFSALYGRKSKEVQGESLRYTTGGVFDFVKHVVDYSDAGKQTTYTFRQWQKIADSVFEKGGSSSRTVYLASSQYNNLITMLWDKVRITINGPWSSEFGFEIHTIRTGSGDFHFVPSWVYARNRARTNQMLCLDFGGPHFKIDVLHDLQYEENLQLPGQKIKKSGYYAALGMQRRGYYHSIIAGLPDVTKP